MDQSHAHQRLGAAHRHHQHQQLAADVEIQILRETLLVNFCAVAALAWLVYDLILCFGDEISIIWDRWYKPNGRNSRRLYVVVRYASVLNLAWFVAVNTSSNLSFTVCNAWYYVVVVNAAVVTLLPDVMILIRINAVYGWKSSYILLTAALFFIQLTTSLGTGFAYISSSTIVAPQSSAIPGCRIIASAFPPAFTLAAWIPSVIAQGIYFALMIKTFLSVLCSLDDNGRPSKQSLREVRTLVPTMTIFIRHGVIYFLIAISAKLVNIGLLLTLSGPLQGIGIPWIMALYPILITRLKLDLGQFLHAIKPPDPLLLSLCTRTMSTSAYSFLQPSPHFDSGPITFAPRAPSRFDLIDDEC